MGMIQDGRNDRPSPRPDHNAHKGRHAKMAGTTVSQTQRRCNSCASLDRVSLTFERCVRSGMAVLGQDVACRNFTSRAPWSDWVLPKRELQDS